MASLASRIARLARSPQGRRLTEKAQRYAQSPEGQRKIRDVRSRLMNRR